MFRGILPKHYDFFDYFEKHISLTIKVCNELQSFATDGGEPVKSAKAIKDLEHELDDITHACTTALHRTFITPLERGDIHLLIKRLDDIADYIDGAVSRIVLYDITELRHEMQAVAKILVRATTKIEEALKGLRDLKNGELIIEKCKAIRELEDEGDALLRSALIRLFKEGEPMMVIMWKEIFERLEKAIDRCKDVANIIEGIVIDSA